MASLKLWGGIGLFAILFVAPIATGSEKSNSDIGLKLLKEATYKGAYDLSENSIIGFGSFQRSYKVKIAYPATDLVAYHTGLLDRFGWEKWGPMYSNFESEWFGSSGGVMGGTSYFHLYADSRVSPDGKWVFQLVLQYRSKSNSDTYSDVPKPDNDIVTVSIGAFSYASAPNKIKVAIKNIVQNKAPDASVLEGDEGVWSYYRIDATMAAVRDTIQYYDQEIRKLGNVSREDITPKKKKSTNDEKGEKLDSIRIDKLIVNWVDSKNRWMVSLTVTDLIAGRRSGAPRASREIKLFASGYREEWTVKEETVNPLASQ